MESVAELIAWTHGELLVSKHKVRQAEGIEIIRRRRDQGGQNLGFSTGPLLLEANDTDPDHRHFRRRHPEARSQPARRTPRSHR